MYKFTPKDYFLNVFEDKFIDRIPTFVQGVRPEFIQKYEENLFENYDGKLIYNPDFDAAIALGFDAKFAHLPSATCEQIEVTLDSGKKVKIGMSGHIPHFGHSYYSGGAIINLEIHEKLFGKDCENIIFPKPQEYKIQADFYKKISDIIFPVPCFGGLFDVIWQSMGFNLFAKEFKRKSNFIKKVIKDRSFVLKVQMEKLVEATGSEIGIVCILDDIAFKGRLMIKPEEFYEYFGYEYEKIVKIAKDAGLHVILHSDGNVSDVIPYLKKIGFEGLQGWEGGADPKYIAENYPDFIVIGFGDVSEILPFGSKEQIINHAKNLIDTFRETKHYIFGPSTVITGAIPYENIKIFIETAKLYGKY